MTPHLWERHRYELITAGHRSGLTVYGWDAARRAAILEASRTFAAVAVWRLHYDGPGRDLRGVVFPDGRWAWEKPLHRQPQSL